MMKKCSKCEELKHADEFLKSKSRKDGLAAYCKKCGRAYDKERRKRPDVKQKTKEYNKEYHKVNKEKTNARSLANWKKNKVRYTLKNKEWYAKNKDKVYANVLKRMSNKNFVKFEAPERSRLLDAFGWKCNYCGVEVHDKGFNGGSDRSVWDNDQKAHIDHIIPLSKGGDSTLENLQILCRKCNLSKRANSNLEIKDDGQIKMIF